MLLATHHGNSIGGEQLRGTHGRDVGDVGEDVNEGHKGDGDEDGARKVPGGDKIGNVEAETERGEKLTEADGEI